MTKGIRNSILTKTRLYKEYINRPNEHNKTEYRQYKNKLTTIIRQAEKSYYSSLLSQAKQSTKELWKIYAELVNKDKRNMHNIKNLVINHI